MNFNIGIFFLFSAPAISVIFIFASLIFAYSHTKENPFYDWINKLRLPNGMLPVIEDSPMNVYAPEIGILSEEYDPFYNINYLVFA